MMTNPNTYQHARLRRWVRALREWLIGPDPAPGLSAEQIEKLARASITLAWVKSARASGVPEEIIRRVIDDD